jgi:hypothetical protein
MYTIYADGKLLHAPHLFNEGCGVFSPSLTVELNKAGSLEFTIPPNNVLYNDLVKLKTIITVFQNGVELFRGRVLHDEKDFYKQRKTYCEGELAFLLDSTQRPYTFDGKVDGLFKQYIENHNVRVDKEKRFKIGKIDKVFSTEEIIVENYEYPSTMDELTAQILDYAGGYIKTHGFGDERYIDLLENSGNTNTQTIEFGRNLLDITEHITAEDIFTVLIPLGAVVEDDNEETTDPKLTIDRDGHIKDGDKGNGIVKNGDCLENPTAIALFGRIEKTQTWSDVEYDGTSNGCNELLALGKDLLSRNIELAMTLTVKAVDLHILDVNTERICVGDWVRVISLPHGLDRQFQCTKITYNMTNPDQNEYVFGSSLTSMTEQQLNEKKNIHNSVSTVVSSASMINASVKKANEAATNANNVIATLPDTYVSVEVFNSYKEEVADDLDFDIMTNSDIQAILNS